MRRPPPGYHIPVHCNSYDNGAVYCIVEVAGNTGGLVVM